MNSSHRLCPSLNNLGSGELRLREVIVSQNVLSFFVRLNHELKCNLFKSVYFKESYTWKYT